MDIKDYLEKSAYIVREVFEGYQTTEAAMIELSNLNDEYSGTTIDITLTELEEIYDTDQSSSYNSSY